MKSIWVSLLVFGVHVQGVQRRKGSEVTGEAFKRGRHDDLGRQKAHLGVSRRGFDGLINGSWPAVHSLLREKKA